MTDKAKLYDEIIDALGGFVDSIAKSSVEMSDGMGLPVTNELRELTGVWNLPSAGWEYTHTDGHKIVAVWVADSGPWKGVAASWLGTFMMPRYFTIRDGHTKPYLEIPAKLTGTDNPLRVYTGTYLVRRQDGTFAAMHSIQSRGYTRARSWGQSQTEVKVTINADTSQVDAALDKLRQMTNPERPSNADVYVRRYDGKRFEALYIGEDVGSSDIPRSLFDANSWLGGVGVYYRADGAPDGWHVMIPDAMAGESESRSLRRLESGMWLVRDDHGRFRALPNDTFHRVYQPEATAPKAETPDHPEDRTLRLGLTYEDGPCKGMAMAWDNITHVEWTNTDGVTRRYDDGVMSEVKPEPPEPPKKWQCIAVDKIMIDAMRGQWCHVGAFSNIDTGEATVQTKMRIESINPTPPYIVGKRYDL